MVGEQRLQVIGQGEADLPLPGCLAGFVVGCHQPELAKVGTAVAAAACCTRLLLPLQSVPKAAVLELAVWPQAGALIARPLQGDQDGGPQGWQVAIQATTQACLHDGDGILPGGIAAGVGARQGLGFRFLGFRFTSTKTHQGAQGKLWP